MSMSGGPAGFPAWETDTFAVVAAASLRSRNLASRASVVVFALTVKVAVPALELVGLTSMDVIQSQLEG